MTGGGRIKTGVFLALYCLVIFLALDFSYSSLFYNPSDSPSARVQNDIYHHGFLPNFAGIEKWGGHQYWMYTNSLGFKDGSARAIPLSSDSRRVLVIGDSFTESVGMSFDNSFVGMLHNAGQTAARKTQFLNAGVSGYSPTVFLRKINFILESGLRFDEVLVALDAGEVPREATMYFCLDTFAGYRSHCGQDYHAELPVPVTTTKTWIAQVQRRFTLTNSTRILIKNAVLDWQDADRAAAVLPRVLERSITTGWPTTGSGLDQKLMPLGVEGGIKRAQLNMQLLADLLASRGIPLTVSVHPWPIQLAHDDRHSRAVEIWRPFCAKNCKQLIDVFPAFFAYKDMHPEDWYQRLFIIGDVHYSAEGNRVMFRELAKHML